MSKAAKLAAFSSLAVPEGKVPRSGVIGVALARTPIGLRHFCKTNYVLVLTQVQAFAAAKWVAVMIMAEENDGCVSRVAVSQLGPTFPASRKRTVFTGGWARMARYRCFVRGAG